jgi:hypothetical protein
MKSRRTRKRNSRRKVRMSRKHQGGLEADVSTADSTPESTTTVATTEPTTEPTTTEPIPGLTPKLIEDIESALRKEGEELKDEIGLEQYIEKLKVLIETNKKDVSKNVLMNISNNTEPTQIEENQTKKVARELTNIIIEVQEKLLAKYEKELKNKTV